MTSEQYEALYNVRCGIPCRWFTKPPLELPKTLAVGTRVWSRPYDDGGEWIYALEEIKERPDSGIYYGRWSGSRTGEPYPWFANNVDWVTAFGDSRAEASSAQVGRAEAACALFVGAMGWLRKRAALVRREEG